MEKMQIVIDGLPKMSLNEYYTSHWGTKSAVKTKIEGLTRTALYRNNINSIRMPCKCTYTFIFTNKRIDCSNCAGMVKAVEDTIFPDDSIVTQLTIISKTDRTAKEHRLIVDIEFEI